MSVVSVGAARQRQRGARETGCGRVRVRERTRMVERARAYGRERTWNDQRVSLLL